MIINAKEQRNNNRINNWRNYSILSRGGIGKCFRFLSPKSDDNNRNHF